MRISFQQQNHTTGQKTSDQTGGCPIEWGEEPALYPIYGPRDTASTTGFLGFHGGYTNEEPHEMMREYYLSQEPRTIAIMLPESAKHRRARELLETTTIKTANRSKIALLWKSDDVSLPDSYPMAFKRLQGLERSLLKDPEMYEKVKQKIAEYQVKKYAHKATPEELAATNPGKIWYLPLNVVVNEKKPGKKSDWCSMRRGGASKRDFTEFDATRGSGLTDSFDLTQRLNRKYI